MIVLQSDPSLPNVEFFIFCCEELKDGVDGESVLCCGEEDGSSC